MSKTVRTIFITLFFVIIAVFALSAWLIFLYPTPGHIIVSRQESNQSEARFEVTTQRHELEKVINRFLHENVESEGLSYSVTLDNDLQFQGDIRILGVKVPVLIGFEPIPQSNGDIVLKQQYFQIGAVSLPANVILEYLKRSYSFPDWIVLQPIKKEIYISTTNMTNTNGVRVHIQKFDLHEDELQFDVYLAGESS